MIDSFWLRGMMAGHKNANDCIKAFSETDLSDGWAPLQAHWRDPTLANRDALAFRVNA
jgi:hypothetical protein